MAPPRNSCIAVCKGCKKKFSVWKSTLLRGGGKCCSWKCRIKGFRLKRRCPVCCCIFTIPRHRALQSYILKRKTKRIFCSRACANPARLRAAIKGRWRSPNTLEKAVLKIVVGHGFKFVGDGKLLIGTRNPDFVHKKKRLIIEAMAGYWHPKSDEPHRIKHYKKHGYKCLVIWRQDLLKNPDATKARVVRFAKAA